MVRDASLLLRVVAKVIDFIIIMAAAEALPRSGWLGGLCYLLISDGLGQGRSIGKRLTGLRVVGAAGAPATLKDSVLRNSTLALGLVLWLVPYAGWLLLTAVAGLEFIILLGSANHRRLGDEIAQTSVQELTEAVQET